MTKHYDTVKFPLLNFIMCNFLSTISTLKSGMDCGNWKRIVFASINSEPGGKKEARLQYSSTKCFI